MRVITAVYDQTGRLASVEDEGLHFEQENRGIRITAYFPASVAGDCARAYVNAPNGNTSVSETMGLFSGDRGRWCQYVVPDACMARGTLLVGFELCGSYGTERFQPIRILIDQFVNLDGASKDNVYVVTVGVGSTTTLPAGARATVTNSGTQKDMILNFGIPQGEKGDKGDTPVKGTDYFTQAEIDTILSTAYASARDYTNTQVEQMNNELVQTLDDKVDKVDGMGLSSNDLTNERLNRLNRDTFTATLVRAVSSEDGWKTAFDDITADGVYKVFLSETDGNYGWYFELLIHAEETGQGAMQAYYNRKGETWHRRRDGSVWEAWVEVYASKIETLHNFILENGFERSVHRGVANGYAPLDSNGKLPNGYLYEQQAVRYGVKFGGAANEGATVQRLYNAVGLVANVGTDSQTAVNDFDSIYPWSERKRCCGYFDDNGNFVVNAYEGEPGYVTDGSNGEVWVETPLFYYLHTHHEDGSEEIVISAHPIGGYKPSPMHMNADGTVRQKAYTAAYPMGLVDGLPTSRSGVYTPPLSLNAGIENARKLGARYTTTTAAEQYTKCLLMWVEFATRDIQTKMMGCSTLAHNATYTAIVAEEATNRVILTKGQVGQYVVGQGIAIGTSLGNTNVATDRTIVAIEAYDDTSSAIVFDGEPVNVAVGNVVFGIPWKTGTCDNVLASSGSPVSNTSGKYTCIYRGEETPFGNACSWIADLLLKRVGSGTAEDPYTYDVYFLPDATKFNNGTLTEDYVKVNYQLPAADGYVKRLGYDARFPFVRIPCEIGASSTTYYADYSSVPVFALTGACVGGSYRDGNKNGPCFWSCYSDPSIGSVIRRARLSYCCSQLRGE